MKYFLSFLLSLSSLFCLADPISLTGNKTVAPGAIETYTMNWENWGSVYENYANVSWTVTGGVLLSSDKHTATIQWDNIPTWENFTATIEIYEDLGSQGGMENIEIVNFVEGTSETCNGILGPPVLTIDFGSGNNPGSPLPAGTTTYQYLNNCGIEPFQYSLTNTSCICHGNWLCIPQDHTPGDNNGYMLIVDGNSDRGEVYRSLVTGLTTAFRYEFSVWVASVSDFDPPRLHFEIQEGNSNNIIQRSDSYTIAYNAGNPWVKISFMFDLPLGTTSAQVVLVNENGSGNSGNDFVVDDISFAPCYPPIIASFSPNPTFLDKSYTCNNGTVNLYSWWPTPAIPYNNPGFKWQRSTNNGVTWVDIQGATTMIYTQTENTSNRYYYRIVAYEISNPSQFIPSNSIIYFVQKMVIDPKIFSVSGCVSSPVVLNPTVNLQYSDPSVPTLSYTYNWSPGSYLSNTQIANPTITLPPLPPLNPPNPPNPPPPINYSYTLTVQNTNFGCAGSNTQTVAHYNPRKVYLVNAFTPNNDGHNDLYYPVNIQDYTNFGAEFKVFNRWGEVIFQRIQGITQQAWGWDGKVGGIPQDGGVFAYTLRIPGCPANYIACPICNVNPPTANNNYTISGTFVLIR